MLRRPRQTSAARVVGATMPRLGAACNRGGSRLETAP